MRKLLVLSLVLLVTAGCVWDHSSVEPRTVIRMERTPPENKVVRQGAPNAVLTNNPAGFGVAPYVSQPASTVTSPAATGSSSGGSSTSSSTVNTTGAVNSDGSI